MAKVMKLNITGIKHKKKSKSFKKRKGWRSGQAETKKSYARWIPK